MSDAGQGRDAPVSGHLRGQDHGRWIRFPPWGRFQHLFVQPPALPAPTPRLSGPRHHTTQDLAGRIGVPSLQLNACENSGRFDSGPFTRKREAE